MNSSNRKERLLKRVGVDVLSLTNLSLRCKECGGVWSPNLGPKGRVGRGSWVCPHRRCNAGYGNISHPRS
jgi:hypothetical protein